MRKLLVTLFAAAVYLIFSPTKDHHTTATVYVGGVDDIPDDHRASMNISSNGGNQMYPLNSFSYSQKYKTLKRY